MFVGAGVFAAGKTGFVLVAVPDFAFSMPGRVLGFAGMELGFELAVVAVLAALVSVLAAVGEVAACVEDVEGNDVDAVLEFFCGITESGAAGFVAAVAVFVAAEVAVFVEVVDVLGTEGDVVALRSVSSSSEVLLGFVLLLIDSASSEYFSASSVSPLLLRALERCSIIAALRRSLGSSRFSVSASASLWKPAAFSNDPFLNAIAPNKSRQLA